MNTDEGKIWYGIGLDTKGLQADAARARSVFGGIADQAQVQAGRIDSSYKSLGTTIARIGGAVGLGMLAKELYTFAGAFDKSMKEVSTISETVSADMDGFKGKILAMGTEIPIAADSAAKALYQIISAGHDGAKGLQVLEVSAKAAVGGVTDTVTAADAITTMLNAYKKDSAEAESISDQLFTTVRLGKTTFGELGQSISQAVPIAASFGIETEQVLAAVATLTKSGTPTAQAMTQIRASIVAASKALGDGYFQTHTFQEGLVEIANRAGGSEAELRRLVPEIEAVNGVLGLTGINAKAAASDLSELGRSTGATKKASAKMIDEAGAQLTILKNNVLKQFHEIGEGVVDVTDSMAKLLNSDGIFSDSAINDVIASLVVLIATAGVYKATMMATNAIQRVGNNVQYAAEMAELVKLLPAKEASANADIEQALVKGQLSQATYERIVAIRAEVAEELKALQVKAQIAASQAAEAAELDKLALKKALYAERVERQAQQELSSAQLKGNAEKIRRAEIKLTFAEENLNIALKDKEATSNNLVTSSLRAKSAQTAVDTMQSNINAAASTGAAKAKTLWTIATGKLTKAFHSLKLAFASNPIGMILTGVTMAISLFTMFGKSAEEAADQTDLLNKSIADLGIETAKEAKQIDDAFAKLSKAKKGTQEYGDAKDAIISKYGEYLRGLSAEVSSLSNVELAYNAVRTAAEDSIKARFKASFIEQANSDAAKKMGEAIKGITDNAKSGFSDDFLKKFPDQVTAINAEIVNALTNTERSLKEKKVDIGAILEDYGFDAVNASRVMHDMDFFDFGDRENFVETFEDALQSTLNIANIANQAFDSTTKNHIENGQKLETVLERRKKLTKELQEATSLLGKMQSDSSTSSETEIEAQKTKIKSIEQSLGIDSKAAAKDYSAEVVDVLLKGEQLKLDVMRDGRAKELAQIEQTKKEKLAAIDKEQKEVAGKLGSQGKKLTKDDLSAFDEQRANVGLIATNDTAAVNKKYDDEIADNWKALTSVFLSEEEKRSGAIRDEYAKRRKWLDELTEGGGISKEQRIQFSMQIDASEAKEQLDALTADYQTYADQRKAIEEKFNADLTALQAKNRDGKLDGNIAEVEKQKRAALSKVKMDEMSDGVDFTKLFGNLDNLTLPSMKVLRDKIKAWIDEAGNSLAPEDLKAVSDAFQNLEIKIADKDPFATLKSSAKELKAANEEIAASQDEVVKSQIAAQSASNILAVAQQRVTAAQKEYDEALKSNDPSKILGAQAKLSAAQNDLNNANAKGVATAKKLTEEEQKLTQAQEDRAAAVVKANEAIGSIADKGQQIVGAAQDVLGIMSDLGVKVPENIANALGGIGQIMDGLGSIDLNKPLSIVTGSIKMIGGLVKTVTSLFNGDNKREAEIERLQGKIDTLSTSYDKLQKAAEKAYSTDAAKLLDQFNELIEKQKTLIKLQIAEEEAKKDTDSGKIDAWKKQIDELDQKAGENVEKKVDIVLGSDWKSDVDSFVSGYMDSFGVVGQGAKEMADQMKKNIIAGLLSKDIGAAVESARKKMEGLVSDGDLSDADMAEIDKMSAEITKIMDQRGKMYEGWLKTDDDQTKNENSFTGAIRGSVASEASVAELGGIFRGQYDKLASIDGKMTIGMSAMMELARTNAAIELNTRATAANTAQTVTALADGFKELKGELTAIRTNTAKDTGSYGG